MAAPTPDREVWYTLTGIIDPAAAQALAVFVNSQIYTTGATRLKVLISSTGGDVDSAIRMYSYLKSLPLEVETVAFGQVDSAANLVYLGGQRRTALVAPAVGARRARSRSERRQFQPAAHRDARRVGAPDGTRGERLADADDHRLAELTPITT